MPRPRKCCILNRLPKIEGFRPCGPACARFSRKGYLLKYEEYEAIRLIDYEGLSQQQAAESMCVSRPTCQRIYESARHTLARALVEGRGLKIGGGNYAYTMESSTIQTDKHMKKIAVPTRSGRVDDHFGHCESYTIFSVSEDGNITCTESLASPAGCGCKSGIASVLQAKNVQVMLAGNMGEGARNVLNASGIEVLRGCSGTVEEVVAAYLSNRIADSGKGCRAHDDAEHKCPRDHSDN